MNNHMTKIGLAAGVAAAGLVLSGCVSTDDFDKHVAEINMRVEDLNARQTALSTRVDGLDTRVNSVAQATQTAQARADAAYKLGEGKFVMTEMGRERVQFDTGKSTLTDEGKATLTSLAERLKSENKNVYLEVRGHTDMRGGKLANRQLGRERAANTSQFLVDHGVPGNKIQLGSWGEDNPKAMGKTPEALAENRRVEVVVLY